LAVPYKAKIHDVFHVSVLKKWVGEGNPIQDHLPTIDMEEELPVPKLFWSIKLVKGIMKYLFNGKDDLLQRPHGNPYLIFSFDIHFLPLRTRVILREECYKPILL
jgi:hypothetical protein